MTEQSPIRGFPTSRSFTTYCLCLELRSLPSPGVTRLARCRVGEKLVFEAEIDLTYVGGIERGKRKPSLLVMARFAEALSVPLAKLFAD
jgi:transcriptional regulator with XRE-family HTH domain